MPSNSAPSSPSSHALRDVIEETHTLPEAEMASRLLAFIDAQDIDYKGVENTAAQLIEKVRTTPRKNVAIENFLSEFGLTTPEGIALMCLAEALLRVPDADTAGLLIQDKLSKANWEDHIKTADDLFLSLSSWALMMSGKVMKDGKAITGASSKTVMGKMVKRMGEPVIRQAMLQAMKILGQQFVMGQTIEDAIKRAAEWEKKGYRYSYDMLGEGARTADDAARYFRSYADAINAIGAAAVKNNPNGRPATRAGISVKLSALHPKYTFANRKKAVPDLVRMLRELALSCKKYDIGLTVDAEEANRLDISLSVIEDVFLDPELSGWDGFGLALQAYQKRALYVIDWLADLSRKGGKRIMVRLVKGAYWDSEIKHAQIHGHDGYPVYTRKAMTDLAYNACAIKLMNLTDCFYPQLATHNAYTAATILTLAKDVRAKGDYEFQRLHGMGEPLYHTITENYDVGCRIYAPVGTHKDLLPYLVRRMLENGANSSFVHQIMDENIPVSRLTESPSHKVRNFKTIPHPQIPLPRDMFNTRINSHGIDVNTYSNEHRIKKALAEMQKSFEKKPYEIGSIIDGKVVKKGTATPITHPGDLDMVLGTLYLADEDLIQKAIDSCVIGFETYKKVSASERADILNTIADLFEKHHDELLALCTFEAGKTWQDGVDEIREAVDFCRYYAVQGRSIFDGKHPLPGPTGESNSISYHPRGPWACISPWNFPLAIFTGQVVAALMAGNSVIAKAAEQTSLIAYRAVELMHEAGIPKDALHLVIGKGSTVGPLLTADERVKGFAFTGSTGVAKQLQREIAAREGAIIPLIAETGGQNAMIVDNTALPEQVVDDVIRSAFGSAGQRCSALRVLFLQDEIAPTIITMLKGAMDELKVGSPLKHSTDVGPVIDSRALKTLKDHIKRMKNEATLLYACDAPEDGTYCPPHVFEIPALDTLTQEVFGPILHIVRFKGGDLNAVIEAINATGYGLTLGIHSRIDFAVDDIASHINVGNAYVNRSMTGAVVGVQPFGGEGLSGTGPKAGGPQYLYRFATERTVSVNTTAAGGNTSLMTMQEADE